MLFYFLIKIVSLLVNLFTFLQRKVKFYILVALILKIVYPFSNLTIYLIFLNFNWIILVLQCCVGFCHTAMSISHKYTYPFHLGPLSHPPTPHPTPLGCYTGLSHLCYNYQRGVIYISSHYFSLKFSFPIKYSETNI